MHSGRSGSTIIGLVVLAALVSGCGDGGAGDPPDDSSDRASGLPQCADVWVDGTRLPKDYAGCERPDGTVQSGRGTQCEVSSMHRYRDGDRAFVAIAGYKIAEYEVGRPRQAVLRRQTFCFAS